MIKISIFRGFNWKISTITRRITGSMKLNGEDKDTPILISTKSYSVPMAALNIRAKSSIILKIKKHLNVKKIARRVGKI